MLLILPLHAANPRTASAGGSARLVQVQDESSSGVQEVHAKKLAGHVHMGAQKNAALAMVLIEELDPGWNKVLSSARTDYQGYFNLKPGRRGKKHYLRLSAKGFSTGQYEVILSGDAPAELNLEMQLPGKSQRDSARPRPAVPLLASGPRAISAPA
ncbi:MAG TPA: hypothetical protein VGR96_19435 [Acidobacteriaceae bacterium]|nr:hypothetical protein [Acidobacteriaceae bacterium]